MKGTQLIILIMASLWIILNNRGLFTSLIAVISQKCPADDCKNGRLANKPNQYGRRPGKCSVCKGLGVINSPSEGDTALEYRPEGVYEYECPTCKKRFILIEKMYQ